MSAPLGRFGAGLEVDLTREQFRPEESVVGGQVEYDVLRARVLAHLTAGTVSSP